MGEDNPHDRFVRDWLATTSAGAAPDEIERVLERALDAVWTRAHVTLGDVTLTAIADRVLHEAIDAHPWLGAAVVEASGFRLDGAREPRHGATEEQRAGSLQSLLVDFLTVLGNLTADILTPALHGAIAALESESTGVVSADDEDGAT